jgi:SAM-dependent methyltransferase
MLDDVEKTRNFYLDRASKEGFTPRGMGWSDTDTHDRRLTAIDKIITRLLLRPYPIKRILDVGCGYGLLPQHWGLVKWHNVTYHGVDLVEEYIDEARYRNRFYADGVFMCEDFMELPIIEPYDVTLAIGTIAWQPKETAIEILSKMWKNTVSGGVMVFTYVPGNPLADAEVRRIVNITFGAKEWLMYQGYAKSGEAIVAMIKGE